jgi:hypothetical protein
MRKARSGHHYEEEVLGDLKTKGRVSERDPEGERH